MALAEIPTIAYEVISEYITKIRDITVKFMMNEEALKQSKDMMQFWTNLCLQEQSKVQEGQSLNIISQIRESLMPIIFQALAIT